MSPLPRLLVLAAVLGAAADGFAQDPRPEPEPYIRLRVEKDGVKALEVATREFLPPGEKGPRIHLVSAIHIADAPFFAAAQESLDRFDLVLFEGVKPAGAGATDASATPEQKAATTRTRLDLLRALARRLRERTGSFPADLDALAEGSGKRWAAILKGVLVDGWGRPLRYEARPPAASFASDGPDGKAGSEDDLRLEALATDPPSASSGPGLQSDMARALGLTYQGDVMDDTGPRWRSSDMSVDELERAFAAAGADASALMALLDGTSFLARVVKGVFGIVGMSRTMAAMVKLSLVESLAAHGEDLGGRSANDRALMKVIIGERNAVVVADLRAVLAKEPGLRDVAVFYGEGHMKDMERRVVGELGYRPGGTTWTAAIRVDPRDAEFGGGFARALREAKRKAEEKKKQEPPK